MKLKLVFVKNYNIFNKKSNKFYGRRYNGLNAKYVYENDGIHFLIHAKS